MAFNLFPIVTTCRAVGNKLCGARYHDQLVETFRKEAEHCDCLQSFFLLHSMGGGTFVVVQ